MKQKLVTRYIVRWQRYPDQILCTDGKIRHDKQCGGPCGYKIRYYKKESGARKYGTERNLDIIVEKRDVYV